MSSADDERRGRRSAGAGVGRVAAGRVTALVTSVMDLHVRIALQEVDQEKRRLISGGVLLAAGGTLMLLASVAGHVALVLWLHQSFGWGWLQAVLLLLVGDLVLAGVLLRIGGQLIKGPYLPQTTAGLSKTTRPCWAAESVEVHEAIPLLLQLRHHLAQRGEGLPAELGRVVQHQDPAGVGVGEDEPAQKPGRRLKGVPGKDRSQHQAVVQRRRPGQQWWMEPATARTQPVQCGHQRRGAAADAALGAVALAQELSPRQKGRARIHPEMVPQLVSLGHRPPRELGISAQVGSDQKEGGRHPQLPQQIQQGVGAHAARSVIDRERQQSLPGLNAEQHARAQRCDHVADHQRWPQHDQRGQPQQGEDRCPGDDQGAQRSSYFSQRQSMPPLLTGTLRLAFMRNAPVSSGFPLSSQRVQPEQRSLAIRPRSE